MKRTTWTIDPTEDVESLVQKRITEIVGRSGNPRGLRSKIVNEAVRNHLAYLNGKRESK